MANKTTIPVENRHFKVFEVEDNQLLFQVIIDDDTEEEAIRVSTFINEIYVGTTFSGINTSKETVREKLDKMTQENADKVYDSFKNIMQ